MSTAFEFFGWLGHWIANWWPTMKMYGAAGLWMAGLVAVAVLVPRLDFKVRVAILAVAGLIALLTISFTVGIKKGADRVYADWDWQLDMEADNGEKLRTDAVDAVRAEPDSVRNSSIWNRDNWKDRKDR